MIERYSNNSVSYNANDLEDDVMRVCQSVFENTSQSSEVKKGFFNANAFIQILIKCSIE